MEKENKKRTQETDNFKRELETKSAEISLLKKENSSFKSKLSEMEENEQKLLIDLLSARDQVDILSTQKKEFEQYRVIQRIASQNSEELIKYKT